MSRDETATEQALRAKGKTAPRVTPDQIDAMIAQEQFEVFFGVLTICVLQLRNGFTVIGESACASPDNFDAEIGMQIARRNARDKIWPLEGYRLRCALFEEETRSEVSGVPEFPGLHSMAGAGRLTAADGFDLDTYQPEPIAPIEDDDA